VSKNRNGTQRDFATGLTLSRCNRTQRDSLPYRESPGPSAMQNEIPIRALNNPSPSAAGQYRSPAGLTTLDSLSHPERVEDHRRRLAAFEAELQRAIDGVGVVKTPCFIDSTKAKCEHELAEMA
jgi:hypothetical protein